MEELKYPPTRLKSNAHEIVNYKYGNGLYEVKMWNNNGNAFYLFDGVTNRKKYEVGFGPYCSRNTGESDIITLVKDQKINGFWVEITLPVKIKLSKYTIYAGYIAGNRNEASNYFPNHIIVLGKNKDEWEICDSSQTGLNETSWYVLPNKTFVVNKEEYFETFRIIFRNTIGASHIDHEMYINEIELFGYELKSDTEDEISVLKREVENLKNELKNLEFMIGLNDVSSLKNECKEEIKEEEEKKEEENINLKSFDNLNISDNINDEDFFNKLLKEESKVYIEDEKEDLF
jgi:hypothetical protein